MKNHFILLTILTLFSVQIIVSQTNINESVVLIKPNFEYAAESFLKDFSVSLEMENYLYSSAILNAYIGGKFGSGFTYIHQPSGRKFIITDKNIVIAAKNTNIELISKNGSSRIYKNCKVVYLKDTIPFAIIELPKKANILPPISFSHAAIQDGDEVFTAGYANIENKAAWMIHQGIISNSNASFHGIKSLIQNTAQTDFGRAGSPLLIRNSQANYGYEIIGMNVLKSYSREDVNFAMNISDIEQFIDDYIKTSAQAESSLNNAVNNFLEKGKTDYKSIYKYIAYKYITGISAYSFYDLKNSVSNNAKSDMNRYLKNGHPLFAMKVALADAFHKQLSNHDIRLSSISDMDEDSLVEVKLLYDNEFVSTTWTKEFGNWKIKSSDFLTKNRKNISYQQNPGIDSTFDSSYGAITLFTGFPTIEAEEMYLGIDFSIYFENYLNMDVKFYTGKIAKISQAPDINTRYYGMEIDGGVYYPIPIHNKVLLLPGIKIFGLANFGSELTRAGLGYMPTFDLILKTRNENNLFFGFRFRKLSVVSTDYSANNNSDDIKGDFLSFELYFGFAF